MRKRKAMFPRALVHMYTTKPILDALFRIGNISAPIIIGNEKAALARSAGGCKRPRDVAPDKAPSRWWGPTPGPVVPVLVRAQNTGLVSTSSSRAPFQRRSLNNADSSGRDDCIAISHRAGPILSFSFIIILCRGGATRRENDHEQRALRDFTWWWVPRVRASIADCRTFRGSLSVFVNLSMKPRSCGTLFWPRRLIEFSI